MQQLGEDPAATPRAARIGGHARPAGTGAQRAAGAAFIPSTFMTKRIWYS